MSRWGSATDGFLSGRPTVAASVDAEDPRHFLRGIGVARAPFERADGS